MAENVISSVHEGYEVGDTKRFQPQCFLIDNIEYFHGANASIAYDNFRRVSGDLSELLGVVQSKNNLGKTFMNLEKKQFALLVPKLRLFKLYPNLSGAPKNTKIEFPFYNNRQFAPKPSDILMPTQPTGVGLKSFSYEMAGRNEAEVHSNITATLALRFQNAQDLAREHYVTVGAASERVSFMDLIHPPEKFNRVHREAYGDEYFRVVIEIGWTVPTARSGLFTSQGINAIEASSAVLNLSLKTHDFAFNQDGTIDLTINYTAYVDSVLKDPKNDIFRFTNAESHLAKKSKAIKESYASISNIDDCLVKKEGNKEKLKKIKDSHTENIKKAKLSINQVKTQMYSNFLKALIARNKIHHVRISKEFIEGWVLQFSTDPDEQEKGYELMRLNDSWKSTPIDSPEISEPIAGTDYNKRVDDLSREKDMAEKEKEIYDTFVAEQSGKNIVLAYMYFGDLLEVALESLMTNQAGTDQNIHVMCGNIAHMLKSFRDEERYEVFDDGSTRLTRINLADVPIALDTFMRWFLHKVIKPQKSQYLLTNFVTDIVTELLQPSLSNACFSTDRLNQAEFNFVVDTVSTDKVLTGSGRITPSAENPLLETHNYIVLYLDYYEKEKLANAKLDAELGIQHLAMGLDRGLVKSIDFVKEDQPAVAESRIARNYSEGSELTRIRGKYNAEVDMIGNSLFRPGMKTYIYPLPSFEDPRTRGTLANKLGLGGYYIVQKIEATFSSEDFKTRMSTKWVSMGDGKPFTEDGDSCEPENNMNGLTPEQQKEVNELPDISASEQAEEERNLHMYDFLG